MRKLTVPQFQEWYPNDDACLQEIFRLRFGTLSNCPKCNHSFNYRRITTKSKKHLEQRKSFQCPYCANQLYPLAGTVYEKSHTPLMCWFYTIYQFSVITNGMAAKKLGRQSGMTYKCAFRMAHRIRGLMSRKKDSRLSGIVNIDECTLPEKEGISM